MPVDLPLVLALVGQTGSGKNRLAVDAVTARDLPIEIISMDSMKVYRGMDIGTARPSAELCARVPHHLLDVADPAEHFDAARWCELAEVAEAGIRERGRVPLVVGGTGMYLKLLVHGHFDGPGADAEVRERLREQAAAHGLASLHERLATVDPAAAERIHPNDEKRVVRALEVFELTGRPISDVQTQAQEPRADRRFGLSGVRWPVEALDERINTRCAAMFRDGWIDEVRRICDGSGFGRQAGDALGYPEIREHLAGTRNEADTLELVQRRTRRFARKQMTWFRQFPIHWLDLDPQRHATAVGYEELVTDLATQLATAVG